MKPYIIIYLAFLLLISGVCALPDVSRAAAISPDLQRALQAAGPQENVSVIVSLADKVDLSNVSLLLPNGTARHEKASRRGVMIRALRDKADQTQAPLKNLLLSRGAGKMTPFWITNAIAVTIPSAVVSELMSLPEVESITLDATFQAPPIVPAAFSIPLWNIARINAPDLWNAGITGSGMVVANLDTGVDVTHPDLQAKWRGGTCAVPPDCDSWFDPHTSSTQPYD